MIQAYSDGSGVGNRIKNLVSALRFAHYNNDRVVSSLGMTEFVNFNQYVMVFDDSKPTIPFMTEKLFLIENDKVKEKLIDPKPIIYHNPNNFLIMYNEIDYQYHNIHPEMIQEWLKYWNLLVFDNNFMAKVEEFTKDFDFENLVGVHVRSWSDAPWRNQNLYSFDRFVKEMEKFPDKKFYLACDLQSEVEKFIAVFGDRIITQNIDQTERHTYYNNNSYFSAFLDLIVLSKCNNLILSYLSTFSECAWWIGNCRARVVVPSTDSLEKQYSIYYTQLKLNNGGIIFNVPKHKHDTGLVGQTAIDDDGNVYICIKENTWAKQILDRDW